MIELGRSDPLAWIDGEADRWSREGLERRLVTLGEARPGRVNRDGRVLLNFASNDYLGLANDPRVIEAATAAAARYGWGAGASPLVSGWREPHEALAAGLAAFEGVEAVALFASGFAANLGAIVALVGPGDAVYADRLNHACLIDGARLSGARLRVYPHNDANRLEAILTRDRGRFRRSMIATDGVFSMDGDVAPLADLADLADRFGAIFLVDEAHGTGVLGPSGRGAAEAAGLAPGRVHVKVGTLSKALGSLGGFVAGPLRLIDWLRNHARTLIYSTALPAAAAAAAHQSLGIAQAEPERRHHLAEIAQQLRADLGSLGLATTAGSGPIAPLFLDGHASVMNCAAYLLEQGYLTPAIRPPTVPVGTSRIRISLTAAHDRGDLTKLLDSIRIFQLGAQRDEIGPTA